ncbi:phytoene desaturase [Metallosphaera yellowstonensis MK1]|uniref:Phytoene desaturase n=1 Tax=Metallosphaera yellowstonensis MK1 TaxID=671065 RepID=H2C3V9_9CREN|nr:phytoene desaturase family protein [Metallosphaera yellowstonensis]EHP69702.1 phytoene desaturase [Metallosphaera yellowstonensis MK1]
MKITIIGSGIGGLSLALYLSNRGIEVTVLEKLPEPGGRARTLRLGEYTFDMGPSWYLMPEVFQEFYKRVGESPPELMEVDPMFTLYSGELGSRGEGRDFRHGELNQLKEYLDDVGEIYRLSLEKFLFRELKVLDLMDPAILRNLNRFPLLSTLDQFNRKYFRDDFTLKALGFSSVFLGGTPFNTPALYSMVNYAIYGGGVYYPKGGFGQMVESLHRACLKRGVEFHFNTEVDGIDVKDGKVRAVRSGGKRWEGDVFVFNADYRFADSLLPYEYQLGEGYWSRRKLAPSGLLLYLGVEGEVNLGHHTIVVKGDWTRHFRALERSYLPELDHTSYYVSYRGATERGLRDLVVLVPMTPGVGVEPKVYYDALLRDLEVKSGSKIQVKVSKFYGPGDFQRDYNAFKGTAFGLAHTLDQTGPFRPPLKHRRIENLYFVGQYTQPGIGVPMVTLSAMIVGDKILSS